MLNKVGVDMSIKFKSNPLSDALIFSGIEINYEKKKLKGQDAKELKKSYEDHKKDINLSYDQFVTIVEKNLSNLNQVFTREYFRADLASKLSELATKRINQKESKFSKSYLFFEKIVQVFSGHGFITKGEWGLKLSNKLNSFEKDSIKVNIRNVVISKEEKNITKDLSDIKDAVNNLDDSEFIEILNDIVFIPDDDRNISLRKYEFYKNLNVKKKEIFEQQLLKGDNWPVKAHRFIQFQEEDVISSFVTDKMLIRFRHDYHNAINLKERIEGDKFFEILLIKEVKYQLQEKNYEAIPRYFSPDLKIDPKEIIKEPYFSDDEIKILSSLLQENVRGDR